MTQSRDLMLLKLAADLVRYSKQFDEQIKRADDLIKRKVGPKGDKGDTPTKEEIVSIVQRLLPNVVTEHLISTIVNQLPKPKEGKTPTKEELLDIIEPLVPQIDIESLRDDVTNTVLKRLPLIEKSIVEKIEKKPKKKASVQDIDGLEQTLSAFRNQLANGYLHGGGVPSLTAGTGITLTPKSDGGFIVTSTGGVGAWVILAADGTTTTFSVASQPTDVNSDGAILLLNNGYTYNSGAGTITFTNAPQLFAAYR